MAFGIWRIAVGAALMWKWNTLIGNRAATQDRPITFPLIEYFPY